MNTRARLTYREVSHTFYIYEQIMHSAEKAALQLLYGSLIRLFIFRSSKEQGQDHIRESYNNCKATFLLHAAKK